MKILQNEMTRTQTSFPTNFGGKLSSIPSFLFLERLHCCYMYFHCSYLYNYYNYRWTLCIKCWVSAFPTEIPYFADTTEKGIGIKTEKGDFMDNSNIILQC
jgi:hypothetical protein